jgi:hypothetical protein
MITQLLRLAEWTLEGLNPSAWHARMHEMLMVIPYILKIWVHIVELPD